MCKCLIQNTIVETNEWGMQQTAAKTQTLTFQTVAIKNAIRGEKGVGQSIKRNAPVGKREPTSKTNGKNEQVGNRWGNQGKVVAVQRQFVRPYKTNVPEYI